MFSSQNETEIKLICMNCTKRYDIPKVLPCGDTICQSCLNNLCTKQRIVSLDGHQNENLSIKIDRFFCPFCKSIHKRPQGDFQTNRALLEILKIQPAKIVIQASSSSSLSSSPTDHHHLMSIEMHNLLDQIKPVVNELKQSITTSEKKFKENLNTIRNKIGENALNIINEVNLVKKQMLNEVDKYEDNLLSIGIDPSKADNQFNIKDLLDDTDAQLNDWYLLLKVDKKTHIDESALLKQMQDAKKLKEKLLIKPDLVQNFFQLKEHLVFNDSNVKLMQNNIDFKSLIGNLSLKAAQTPISVTDGNNNNLTVQLNENENCNVIDYSKVITDNLNPHNDIFISLFNNGDTFEYVLGINQKHVSKQRFKSNLKLLDSKSAKLEESINFDCLLVRMLEYKTYLITLAFENDKFALTLYDNALKLLKKKIINFTPLYVNVYEDGIYLLTKEIEYHESTPLIHVFDWNLKEVDSTELDQVLKNNRFYLNNTSDLFIINDKIFLVDKLNSRINIISCKNGDIIKEIYYNNRVKSPQQQAIQKQLPKVNAGQNFFIEINSFENVIVLDVIEKVLIILDNKICSMNQNIIYKKNLGFIQNISSFQLIDNYVFMIHDKVNKLIHTIHVK